MHLRLCTCEELRNNQHFVGIVILYIYTHIRQLYKYKDEYIDEEKREEWEREKVIGAKWVHCDENYTISQCEYSQRKRVNYERRPCSQNDSQVLELKAKQNESNSETVLLYLRSTTIQVKKKKNTKKDENE